MYMTSAYYPNFSWVYADSEIARPIAVGFITATRVLDRDQINVAPVMNKVGT